MYEQMQNNKPARRHTGSGYILGVFLLIAGSLLLIDRSGLLPLNISHIILSWPMILVALGVMSLSRAGNNTTGIILLLVGGFFLLPRIFYNLPHDFHRNFWPLILIIAGVVLLMSHNKKQKLFGPKVDKQITDENYFQVTAMMGGGERIITSQNLQGGKVECLMGGAEVSLVNAKLSKDKNVIDLSIMFGGITFIIPSDWTVHSEVNAILGGYTDNRTLMGTPSTQPEKTIYIRGNVMFGGCEVKSY